LKQIGLAIHNYHDTHKHIPPWGFDFTYNPNPPPVPPGNPLGNQTQGHSAFTLLLPYIEQDNLYNSARIDLSVIDPHQWDPSWAIPLGCPPGNPALATPVKPYMCPSAPERVVDYEAYFVSKGLPPIGPFILGYTDYAVVKGYTKWFNWDPSMSPVQGPACAPGSPFSTASQFADDNVGAMGKLALRTPSGMQHTLRFADVLDGLSNTIFVGEDAGRQQNYIKGGIPYTAPPPNPNYWDGPNGFMLNAAIADYNAAISVAGFSPDGKTVAGGCACVNANNAWQLFSFHPGGVNAVRGDGSVSFLQETVSPGVLAALITRAGREIFNEDQ
jgi:hypothetical protein